MQPSPNSFEPFRFYDLASGDFEKLCRAIFRELEGVADSLCYGTRGQADRGVDVVTTFVHGAVWAIQCKACEPRSALKHLKEAVADFEPHISFWKKKGVSRFIVAMGCGVADTKTIEERDRCIASFAAQGIQLALWDSDEIVRHLSGMRSVAQRYLPAWVTLSICGAETLIDQTSALSTDRAHKFEIPSELSAELSAAKDEELDHLREAIRCGQSTDVELKLRTMLESAAWPTLKPSTKGRVFRMLSTICVNSDRLADARALLERSKDVDPAGKTVLTEIPLIREERGTEAALASMPEPTNQEEFHLQIVLMFGVGKVDDGLKKLDVAPFGVSADTHRLKALGLLSKREIDAASAGITEAEFVAPKWKLVREAAAYCDYFSAIVPTFEGWSQWDWPLTTEWHLVRQDSRSAELLRRSAARWSGLANDRECGSAEWLRRKGWQLACLASARGAVAEAEAVLSEILSKNPADEVGIIWGLKRNLKFDRDAAKRALAQAVAVSPSIRGVQALFSVYVTEQDFDASGRLLDEHKSVFEIPELRGTWAFQRAQVFLAMGENLSAKNLAALQPEAERLYIEAALARVEGMAAGWTPELAEVMDKEFRSSGTPASLFASCEAHLFARQFTYVSEHADDLLENFPTIPALQLAIEGTAGAANWFACLSLIEKWSHLFKDDEISPVIKRTRIECLRQLGRLPEATAEAEKIQAELGIDERISLFEMLLSAGDVEKAISTARIIMQDPDAHSRALLHLAHRLFSENVEVSKALVIEAQNRGAVDSPDMAAAAAHLMMSLNMEPEAAPLLKIAMEAASQPGSAMKQFSLAELLQMQRDWHQKREELFGNYRAGSLTNHAFAIGARESLAGQYYFF